jgi:uncharacterized membrane protein YgaE (UPF0421/DUF939 family)
MYYVNEAAVFLGVLALIAMFAYFIFTMLGTIVASVFVIAAVLGHELDTMAMCQA